MAKKKSDWQIDEWDESLDVSSAGTPGKRRTASGSPGSYGPSGKKQDPFGIPGSSGASPWDEWDWPESNPGAPGGAGKRGPKKRRSAAAWLIPTAAGVLAAAALAFFALPKLTGQVNPPPDGVTAEPVTPEQITEVPVTPERITEEPVTPEPATAEPVTPEPITKEPVTPEPITAEPVTPEPATEPPTEAPTASPLEDNEWFGPEYRYYYQQLTEKEKAVFAALYSGILNFQNEVRTPHFTDTELDHVMYAINNDAPELFQWNGACSYTYGSILPEYRMTRSEYEADTARIHGIIRELRGMIPAGADDYTKEKIINEWIVDHCDYLAAGDDSTALADACLCSGKAQCSGYSRALLLLLRSFGIECLSLDGTNHEWDLARINGEWYNVDTTWNDTGETPGNPGENRCFMWLNVPDRLVTGPAHTRIPHPPFTAPECTSIRDHYAVRDGGYVPAGTGDLAAALYAEITRVHGEGNQDVIVLMDDPRALREWQRIYDRFYQEFGGYGWGLVAPGDLRTVFAVRTR